MKNLFRISLILLSVPLAAAPLRADLSSAPPTEEPKFEIHLERTSHVVRQIEDRFHFRYRPGPWRFEALAAQLAPRFREDRDQIGLLVHRAFGWGELTGVVRQTNKPIGDDMVASLGFRRANDQQTYGAELTFGQADLLDDDFVIPDGESQFVGRLFWHREGGLELTLFSMASATFDLTRNLLRGQGVTDELLHRLPRSVLAGAETLADIYVDEDVLEDSTGLVVGFGRGRYRAHVYAKSGEQTIRGIPEGDDFTGFGGDLKIRFNSWSLDTELDLREIDPVDGFGSVNRGRLFLDFRHQLGWLDWGLGVYTQGEAESLSEIPDFYDSAGAGFTVAFKRSSGTRIGLWALWEDNSPEAHVITRLGTFYRTDEREYGVGVRRDELGTLRFKDETTGPFVFFKIPFGKLLLDGDLGVQDGDAYGHLSFVVKR